MPTSDRPLDQGEAQRARRAGLLALLIRAVGFAQEKHSAIPCAPSMDDSQCEHSIIAVAQFSPAEALNHTE
ncbi:hypothetical protein ACHMW5_10545 [Azospirillum melinis]|uniref:hypothetical protein n=1 Tax=Azospirillum melinis TaxID=328839 RepID=UPI00375643CC